jgi:membrane-associated phospholipid phosphatase
MPRFPADYDYDYDYDYTVGGVTVHPVGVPWQPGPGEQWPRLQAEKFPRRYWDAHRFALVVLAEFAEKSWKTSVDPGPFSPAGVQAELNDLAAIQHDDRAKMLDEIIKQSNSLASYWLGLLMFNSKSHPATFDLINVALRVGQFAVMFFKHKYNRPRPSQLDPRIFPWIDVPGHPSYPSGHATEAHLLSLCLAEVVPDAKLPLTRLAKRVAENREIAGVHYRSDSDAGEKVAAGCLAVLKTCTLFNDILAQAKTEWTNAPS